MCSSTGYVKLAVGRAYPYGSIFRTAGRFANGNTVCCETGFGRSRDASHSVPRTCLSLSSAGARNSCNSCLRFRFQHRWILRCRVSIRFCLGYGPALRLQQCVPLASFGGRRYERPRSANVWPGSSFEWTSAAGGAVRRIQSAVSLGSVPLCMQDGQTNIVSR